MSILWHTPLWPENHLIVFIERQLFQLGVELELTGERFIGRFPGKQKILRYAVLHG